MGAGAGPVKRGLLWGLSWLAGVGLQLQQPALWPAPANAACLAAAALAALALWRWRQTVPGAVLLALAAAALAFASTAWRAERALADRLVPALDGQDLLVTGVVAELPRMVPEGVRFVFEPESTTWQGQPVQLPARLSLGWYRNPVDDSALTGPAEALRAGQRWRLPLRVRSVHGTLNPHGFDLELWAFERGLGGGGYVRAKPETPALKLAENTGHPVERLRQQVRDTLATHVADPAAAGVLAALAIGDQAAIDLGNDKQVLR